MSPTPAKRVHKDTARRAASALQLSEWILDSVVAAEEALTDPARPDDGPALIVMAGPNVWRRLQQGPRTERDGAWLKEGNTLAVRGHPVVQIWQAYPDRWDVALELGYSGSMLFGPHPEGGMSLF